MVKKKVKQGVFCKIGENITALMSACAIDATELSQQTGLPSSTISRLRSSITDFSPNLSSLLPIADYFCISLSQLIGEEPLNENVYATFKPTKIHKLPIPVLHPETVLSYLSNKEPGDNTLLHIDFPLGENAFAYFLRGNAMEPQFPDKTLLIIDPSLVVENLDHVLILPAGKKIPIFRQLLIDGEEKYIRTLNPSFNEFIKLTDNSHQFLGVMVQARINFKDFNLPSAVQKHNKKINAS